MISRRFMLTLPLSALAASPLTALADSDTPPVAIQRFYDTLLGVMKVAKQQTFDQRYSTLQPAILRTFDLALMARIAVGPIWARLTPDLQQRVAAAFSRYTIATYASRFDGYSGERFTVDPNPVTNASGVVVQSWLVQSDGKRISLNYLMRQGVGGTWQAIDVFLSGTVSELATRRSEFASVLQRDGADGLARMLDQRAAALRTG